jgi:hypothetical protein
MDEKTCLPVTDENGKMKIRKTAGFSGTQSDIIKAVQNQGILMIHITDAITVLNISHDPTVKAEIIPEGYVRKHWIFRAEISNTSVIIDSNFYHKLY